MTANPAPPIRVFHLQPGLAAQELDGLPEAPPARGYYWIACTRTAFGAELARLQAALQRLTGQQLVDLHVSDLLNAQLPSHYDYTSQYDLLVVRRLAQAQAPAAAPLPGTRGAGAMAFATFSNPRVKLGLSSRPDLISSSAGPWPQLSIRTRRTSPRLCS